MAIVTQISVNCSYTKASKQQSTAHISIVKVNYNKVLQTHTSSFQTHTLMFTGVVNVIESITQNRNQIIYLQNKITKKHNIMAHSSHTKIAFLLSCSTYHHYQMQENNLQ